MRRVLPKKLIDLLLFLSILGLAVALSLLLSRIDNDNNPFAMGVFILAVAGIARLTSGYFWGIAASLVGTFCVNYMFTVPFWEFDISYPGYPLTFAVMLVVSVLISALTTQIKQQEQLRLEMEREKMRADLLRAIAHDIRTPLASMLGASSAMTEQELSREDEKELLLGIRRDAEWLVRVTENLLSVTRFSGGSAMILKQDEVLEEIIGSAVIKYHRRTDSLPVEADALPDILVVPMDGTLIEQVLINLFDNVSAHAEDATRIWLHVRPLESGVEISVEDDGRGIPAALLPTLFQGGAPRSGRGADDRRGMGIGLSVCRTIILAHGGDMRAEKSHLHGGAALIFTLPGKEESK